MRSRHGWGFKLDYDREIKFDEALIVSMTTLIDNGWFHPTTIVLDGVVIDVRSYHYSLIDLALADAFGTAAKLGLTVDDLGDIARTRHRDHRLHQLDGSVVVTSETATPGAYQRGDKLLERIVSIHEGELPDEATAHKILKKAKADLARHKRNKAKYGPVAR